MKRSPALLPALAAIACGALLCTSLTSGEPRRAFGQTIPLRPTATAMPGAFAAVAQPTPPSAAPGTLPPVRTAAPSPAVVPPSPTAANAAPSPVAYRVEHVTLSTQ